MPAPKCGETRSGPWARTAAPGDHQPATQGTRIGEPALKRPQTAPLNRAHRIDGFFVDLAWKTEWKLVIVIRDETSTIKERPWRHRRPGCRITSSGEQRHPSATCAPLPKPVRFLSGHDTTNMLQGAVVELLLSSKPHLALGARVSDEIHFVNKISRISLLITAFYYLIFARQSTSSFPVNPSLVKSLKKDHNHPGP